MAINGVINNVLKTLKDFDFGKQSLENTINTEIDQMITKFTPRDIKIGSHYSSYQYTLEDCHWIKNNDGLNRICSNC